MGTDSAGDVAESRGDVSKGRKFSIRHDASSCLADLSIGRNARGTLSCIHPNGLTSPASDRESHASFNERLTQSSSRGIHSFVGHHMASRVH